MRSFTRDRLVHWRSLPLRILLASFVCQIAATTLAVSHILLRGFGVPDRIAEVAQSWCAGLATASLFLLSAAGWLGCTSRLTRTAVLVGLVAAVALRSPGWGYSPQLTAGQVTVRLQLTRPESAFAAVYAMIAILVLSKARSRFAVAALAASGGLSILAALPGDVSNRTILLMAVPLASALAAALSTVVVVRVLTERHRDRRLRLPAPA